MTPEKKKRNCSGQGSEQTMRKDIIMSEWKLSSEICPMYISSHDVPNVMNIIVVMKDKVDGQILKKSVDSSMKRYPYFGVRLKRGAEEYVFEKNERPVAVVHSSRGVELSSEDSNFHLLSFSWYEDRIELFVSHALTDGTGLYEFLKTVLYYYCTDRYHKDLFVPGVRKITDEIPIEEWENPALNIEEIEPENNGELLPGLNITEEAGLSYEKEKTAYHIAVAESQLMSFIHEKDGSPATILALLLSRGLASLFPESSDMIRVSLCINLRKGMENRVTHHCLVGGIWLEYLKKIRDWSFDTQMTAYRGRLFTESMDEKLLAAISNLNRQSREILSLKTDEERVRRMEQIQNEVRHLQTATISYVGKANFGDIEQYISDYYQLAPPVYEDLLLEVSAINGVFYIDFIQSFSDKRVLDAFLGQLKELGIEYDYRGCTRLTFPGVRFPWTDQRG